MKCMNYKFARPIWYIAPSEASRTRVRLLLPGFFLKSNTCRPEKGAQGYHRVYLGRELKLWGVQGPTLGAHDSPCKHTVRVLMWHLFVYMYMYMYVCIDDIGIFKNLN